MNISDHCPAGNIKVISIDGHHAELDTDSRDTEGGWFYWCFKAEFDEPGEYSFRFLYPDRIAPRGPAVSYDGGSSWQWLSPAPYENTQSFTYDCPDAGQEVIFCMGMQYLQKDWEKFVSEFRSVPYFKPGVLCKSRKGRDVEMLEIRDGNPSLTWLVTSRHHAGEIMATHALEGLLRYVMGTLEFRRKIAVVAIPFVDKDGVEDGDQGKNRSPKDHARDYPDPKIYPECQAISRLITDLHTELIQDLHCPYIRGGANNETIYMIGDDLQYQTDILSEFSAILEQESPACAPYFQKNNVLFGQTWNTIKNFEKGWSLKRYGGSFPFVKCSQSMEIPFANLENITIDHGAMLEFGAALGRAMLKLVNKMKWE